VPPPRSEFTEAQDRYERGVERQARLGETPHERHKRYVNDYVLRYGRRESAAAPAVPPRNDYDVLRERHRFIWEDGEEPGEDDWEGRQAKRYYDKLYKEYCLADFSRYAERKLALRWRTEEEVLTGKGVYREGGGWVGSELVAISHDDGTAVVPSQLMPRLSLS
jgi:protein FRA10AC1